MKKAKENLLLFSALLPLLGVQGHGAPQSGGHALRGLIGYGIDMWNPTCAYACHRTLSSVPLNCSVTESHEDGDDDDSEGGHGHDDGHDEDDEHNHNDDEDHEDDGHGHEQEQDQDHEHEHDRKTTLIRRHGGNANQNFETPAECFANDDAFLQSLAWCIDQKCFNQVEPHDQPPLWQIERFWETDVVPDGHEAPKYSYGKAYILCGNGPQLGLAPGHRLEQLSLVDNATYSAIETYLKDFSRNEKQGARYMLRLVFIMISLPLFLTFVNFLVQHLWPVGERMLVTHIVYPALVGRRHHKGLPYGLGIVPTRGQSLFLLFVIITNLLLLRVSYEGSMPNSSYADASDAFWSYFSNRAGSLAFANLIVIVLYSGRNNPLIWLTGWDHSTFLLLHRWVAYICILEVAIHGAVKLVSHLPVLWTKFTEAYWNVGFATAVLFCGIVPVITLLPFRRRWYELFLDLHITTAVLLLTGTYYHIYLTFGHKWGYENWPLVAALIWAAERFVRAVRIASQGPRTAIARTIDHNHGEIIIEDTEATGYVYVYLLRGWRIWENHPFSVASTVVSNTEALELEHSRIKVSDSHFKLDPGTDSEGEEEESNQNTPDENEPSKQKAEDAGAPLLESLGTSNSHDSFHNMDNTDVEGFQDISTHIDNAMDEKKSGMSFLIRRQRGATRALLNSSIPRRVLIEGPYPSMSTRKSLLMTSPHVICIAGGSGITAVLPILRARQSGQLGRTCLYWSCHSEELVEASGVRALEPVVQTHVKLDSRWNLPQVILRESAKVSGNLAVVSCGPGEMADDVRWAVVQANKRKTTPGVVRLYEECFSR